MWKYWKLIDLTARRSIIPKQVQLKGPNPGRGTKMKLKQSLAVTAGLAVIFSFAALTKAQNASSVALSGVVSSQEEGVMEGVLVSARKSGSPITVTVVSDAQGRYSFPRSRLEPGQYSVRIRAIGYEFTGDGRVDVMAQGNAQLGLKLNRTKDISRQLSNGEWLLSMTGTDEQKQAYLNCVVCHTMEPIVRSRHNAAEFAKVLRRMSDYAQVSSFTRPQLRPSAAAREGGDGESAPATGPQDRQAQHAATVNLSSSPEWTYSLKTNPRPKGKATNVIITEYDLPRPETLPHDAMVDSQGMVWYSDFGSQYLGRLDPKSGAVVEYPVPLMEPSYPKGSLDVAMDREGNVWLGTMFQGVLARFNPKIEKFETWKSPKFAQGDGARTAFVTPEYAHVDGKVWVGADEDYHVDLKSNEWVAIDYKRDIPKESPLANRRFDAYDLVTDSKNNAYGLNMIGEFVTKIDGKTMKATPFATPTRNSGPRRGHMDARDRLWFGEFRGNKIGMFDTRTEKFQEYAVPTPWTNPYDAILDNAGYVWTGGMNNDLIVRLNTRTGEITEYLLPRTTNLRRVDVDNSTNPPTFWVGNNLGASIIKVEPQD
jgi:streptogramin lyase